MFRFERCNFHGLYNTVWPPGPGKENIIGTANGHSSQGWQRRHTVVLLCFFATFICYIDRVNISVAIIPMAKQFGWSDTERGFVLSSFFVGYLITQVLGGSLAARLGGKAVLGFGVLWWSLFTLLTPLSAMTSFPVLIAARILMGLGEGVAFPATYHLLGRWVPPEERTRAASFNLSAIPVGTLFAVSTTPIIAVTFGWPAVFYIFGAAGFVWFIFWWFMAADKPETLAQPGLPAKSDRSAPDDAEDRAIPWRRILREKPVWAIIVAHFCSNWGLYVLLAWMPSYFSSQLGVNLRSVWIYISLPWIAMFLAGNLAGWLGDRMVSSGLSVTLVRKSLQVVGSVGPAIALIALAGTNDVDMAVALLTAALGLSGFCFAGFASNHLDISPRHAGAIFGISNTAGTMPGIIGVALTGILVDHTGSYASAFYVTAGVYTLGLAFYLVFGTGKKII
jgi:ACS family sodium-dependent inorganic phosphate cotransporter